MSRVVLDRVRKTYGHAVAVDNVSLQIEQGEFVTLLGASGSGKTTCLRMVAGFVIPTSGRVNIGEQDVTTLPPYKRDTAMVFQQYALFPHLTVQDNIAFGLSVRRLPRAEVRQRTQAALDLVRLGTLGSRYPNQLSGGQRQRVALARAVVLRPKILLLDEPLGALDLKLREELQTEIKRVQSSLGITTLFVTHDQSEALSMSDRVAVMREGRIVQVDSPTELYRSPISEYVARFIGRITLLPVQVVAIDGESTTVRSATGAYFTACRTGRVAAVGDNMKLAIRPEAYRTGNVDLPNRVEAMIEHATYQGAGWMLSCRDESETGHIVDLPWGSSAPRIGDRISLTWAPDQCRLLPLD